MFLQLAIGSFIITLSIVVEVIFVVLAIQVVNRYKDRRILGSHLLTMIVYLASVTLWLLLAYSIVTWVWALTLLILQSFATLEEALYFSLVAFTSLGFGDILLEKEWRILSGMIAANGLLLIGLNTAVLVESLRELLNSETIRE